MTVKKSKIQQDIISAMEESSAGTKGYDTVATVKRVEDNTAWVHIPGGVDETPVTLSIDAKSGDIVRIRVAGGKAWVTGNDTAPPTDDTTAINARINAAVAKITAENAETEAAGANKKADSAGSAAEKAAGAALTAGNMASSASASAATASQGAARAENAANAVNVKLTTLIRQTDDGIEAGRIPDAGTLPDGSSITLPLALVNTDGSFDVLLATYKNSGGTVAKTDSVRIASFGADAVIGSIAGAHAHIDSDSFDIIDAFGNVRASMGGSTPMFQIGKFTFINRENGNLTLRLNEG